MNKVTVFFILTFFFFLNTELSFSQFVNYLGLLIASNRNRSGLS